MLYETTVFLAVNTKLWTPVYWHNLVCWVVAEVSEEQNNYIFTSGLRTAAIFCLETLVITYKIIQCHVIEDAE